MNQEFIEKIYAGWLAKIIGIRLGAPIEGWTYEKIKNIHGELDHYPVDYREFAADDDSNGPLFFLKALEDRQRKYDPHNQETGKTQTEQQVTEKWQSILVPENQAGKGYEQQNRENVQNWRNLCAQDVAEALLNYAPYEHGFFWWGGYGTSTEHTAYLNLRNGIPAPRSGSIAQNGATVAEQIGGQIFIDTWGLVTPGNPDLAAKFAREAASVTHDGNGIYGGIFVAVCISYAFVEQDITKILEKGLSYIPVDCEYTRAVRAVMRFHEEHPQNWRDCFEYIFANFGYDKYPGNCHIIPNIAVMILALLYGEGDFSRTLTICNMCGWDTDCNVGNVATIMGVRGGLEVIDYEKWRKPVNDFLACSSVIGSMNIMDIPFGAVYIVKLAYTVAGEEMPEPWKTIVQERMDSCHFEYPGSTHAMRIRVESCKCKASHAQPKETSFINTAESAATGYRSLKLLAKFAEAGEKIFVYKKTHYEPEDFHDSRYDPSFSPLVYPGQMLHGSAMIPEYGCDGRVSLYVKEVRSGVVYESAGVPLAKGQWRMLSFEIPPMKGGLLGEMGFCFRPEPQREQTFEFVALVDDLYAEGTPDYSVEMKNETVEKWPGLHREISQFTRLKGLLYLEEAQLHLSCADFAEAYTGHYSWKDYTAEYTFTPLTGEHIGVNFRVQGAIRSYAFALLPNGKAAILKNDNGYRSLAEMPFEWHAGDEYTVKITVCGNQIRAEITANRDRIQAENTESKNCIQTENCRQILEVCDTESPYLTGFLGISVQNGSHAKYRRIAVGKI